MKILKKIKPIHPAPAASTAGPCPIICKSSRTPRHWKLPSTIAQPNHPVIGDWLQLSGDWSVTNCRSILKKKHINRIISLQVFKMLTTGQLQLLGLQRVNQTALIVAMMVYRRLIRRKQRQYWLRPSIARRPLFLEFLHIMFNS